ncbi:AMP-binding protein [Bradyrhizobium sp. BR 1433]|uniref:AMP-binding protein n=1 Tax=Bradyrhizobium sp. BR 1433 TaxID=3447967 RepID=UPI003EE6E814
MMVLKSAPSDLQDRVEIALGRLDALEFAYETTTLGQLVSMRARTHGSAIAIDIFERGERATYAEMDRWSNSYAHALRAFGVRKGDRVGVMLPNRIEFPILWFALAKLGAIVAPINMRYTPREVEYVLSDTQAKFAIVDESAVACMLRDGPLAARPRQGAGASRRADFRRGWRHPRSPAQGRRRVTRGR